ncbi:MAG TPA: TadE family protein [Croceibacterium sp.]|nr:TadE family protein [Croceibacterium sp.]
MTARRLVLNLGRDLRGAAIVEFAILAPLIFAMLFGALQAGIQMWCYNSLRSIAADTARYTMVEYQKQNQLSTDQIASKAVAIGVNSPYNFDINQFSPVVGSTASDISGMTKFTMTMTYTPPSILDFTGIKAPTLTITRPIYVTT